jgi:hypothetical protein
MRLKRNPELTIKPFHNSNDKRPKDLHPALPWNFSMYLIGQPGSGKTVFWLNMITIRNMFYYRKFDKVIIFSASFRTISREIKIPDDQKINGFDEDILTKWLTEQEDTDENTLFIFDDVVADIERKMKPMMKMIFNRRHLGKGSSVMIISQKYNVLPKELRAMMSHFIMYNKGPEELEDLRREVTSLDRKEFKKVSDFVFQTPHTFLNVWKDNPVSKMFYKNFDLIVFDEEDEPTIDENAGTQQLMTPPPAHHRKRVRKKPPAEPPKKKRVKHRKRRSQ